VLPSFLFPVSARASFILVKGDWAGFPLDCFHILTFAKVTGMRNELHSFCDLSVLPVKHFWPEKQETKAR